MSTKPNPEPWFPGLTDVAPGKAITAIIYGHAETCIVLAVHPFGTIDANRTHLASRRDGFNTEGCLMKVETI